MKKIGIIPNGTKDFGLKNTKKVIDALYKKAEIYMDIRHSGFDERVEYIKYEDLFLRSEYIVVIGGDGTMLGVASECAQRSIPVLGINLGRVGFLTDIEPENTEYALNCLVEGKYEIEKRMLLEFEKIKNGQTAAHGYALNDVVIAKSAYAKLISVELYTADQLVNRYIADGLILATPTGSTGYSISAGGPVVDPAMSLYVATPICPHMLSARSAVMSADNEIIIRLDSEYLDNSAIITADGDVTGDFAVGDELKITKSRYEFEIIKIGSHSFYDTVLKKLP